MNDNLEQPHNKAGDGSEDRQKPYPSWPTIKDQIKSVMSADRPSTASKQDWADIFSEQNEGEEKG